MPINLNTKLLNKKIILGISGSIAAYKAAFLTRLLIKNGADVQILMTESATKFISPLTLSTLSKKSVLTNVIAQDAWNNHVELGLWADAMIVAPTTATTLSKMANGLCDNIITAVYLSARCPIFFAPAMDLDMWKHPATKSNVQKLMDYGNHLIPVEHGELASGLVGNGRMAEPENIIKFVAKHFAKKKNFEGKKVLITAGPTYEHLDPVRFIGNHSSGKMGISIAEVFADQGAMVHLILGPSKLVANHPNIKTTNVVSAQQMYEVAHIEFNHTDIAVLAAAVADYRPIEMASQKIKKKGEQLEIVLEKTPDIAASLGKIKRENQLIVGFALETNNELENAKSKLLRKNFDFIVLNSLRDKGAGFNFQTNKITIIHKDNKIKKFELKSKEKVAEDIVDEFLIL